MSVDVEKTSQAAEVWRRLKRNKAAIVGGVIVAAFLLVALLAPVIAPYPPNEGDLAKRLKPRAAVSRKPPGADRRALRNPRCAPRARADRTRG